MAVVSNIIVPLASPGNFDNDFNNAENAYYLNGQMIDSANRFLKVWRVTRGELERQLHTPFESQLATLYQEGERSVGNNTDNIGLAIFLAIQYDLQ
jgi:hypothetical protein